MIPVFVISLARSVERRAMVVQQMAHLGIDFEFVDATDGKALSSAELAKVDLELAKEVCGHELSFGEIGCAMSHIRVYERIVAEGIDRCVVLEDDIYLHMHSKAIIETIVHSCQSEIVFLHHGKAKRWPFLSSLPGGYRLARYLTPSRSSKRGVLSTAGYVLTLAGAKKLLQCAYPLRMPSDYLTGRLQLNGLSASGVEPCCLDVDLFTTTIDVRAYGHYLK